jgi:AbrB family looped-hinge helix DNA binding protein
MSRLIGYLTIDHKGRTTIPQKIREELQLGEDTLLRIERADSGAIELVPSVTIPQDQLWYHSAEGRAMFAEVEADLAAGRFTRTTGEAETRAFLDSLKKGTSAKKSAKKPLKKTSLRAAKR